MNDDGRIDHVEDGTILAHLDGELDGGTSSRVAAHLSECAGCRRRWEELSTASAVLASGLDALDVAPPDRSAEEVRQFGRSRTRERSDDRVEDGPVGRRPFGFPHAALLKAAVLVLGVATAASAVVPGSPVRAWIADAVRAVAGTVVDDRGSGAAVPDAEVPDPTTAPQESGLQGVTIPVTDSAVVRVPESSSELRLRIRSIRGGLLSVTGRGARYRAGSGTIEVTAVGDDGELHLGVPESVPAVRVTGGGRTLVEGTGRNLRFRAARVDTVEDGYVVYVPGDAGSVDGGGSEP
jgi:anti-sigma factor RsiW